MTLDYGIGLLSYALVKFLAILIILVDVLSLLIGLGEVTRHKQFHGLATALHATRCIDARTNLEDYIADGDFTVVELTYLYYRTQSHVGI